MVVEIFKKNCFGFFFWGGDMERWNKPVTCCTDMQVTHPCSASEFPIISLLRSPSCGKIMYKVTPWGAESFEDVG